MRDDVHEALAAAFDDHRILGRIHDVPPHEVYEVRVDGRRAVYKGDTGPTGSAATEGQVMAFVGERTGVPVPEVLRVGDGYFVAAWHPDAPAPDESHLDESWASAAGECLGRLHAETAPSFDEYGQFRRDDGLVVDGHGTWHAAALAYVRRHRPVLARHGHAEVADAVVEFLADHPDAFAGRGGPVCCHGWATPEHVAVEDGRVACVVDFEHAIAAPGEFDYWRTVVPTFSSGDLEATFRAAYESVRSLPDGFERREPLYGVLNGIYYFESLYVQDRHGPAATADRADRLRDRVLGTLDRLRAR